jgi:hypothetical protein
MSGQFAIPSRSHRTEKVPDGVRRYIHEESRPAANANGVITDTLDRLILESTSAATPSITTTSAHEGQVVSIYLITESSTGTYTMTVAEGTLTFAAVDDAAVIERVDGEWRVRSLRGATIV